jgi:hypothetical protein
VTKTQLNEGFSSFVTLAADLSHAISDGTFTNETFYWRVWRQNVFIEALKQSGDKQLRIIAVKMREIFMEMRKLIGRNGMDARKWKRVEANVKRKAAVWDRLATEVITRWT